MDALNFSFAPAVEATQAPPIPKAQIWARKYLASSSSDDLPLLDLSQGVPGRAPHPSFLKALGDKAGDPMSAKYGAILGEPSFREAVAEEMNVLYWLSTASGAGEGPSTAMNGESAVEAPRIRPSSGEDGSTYGQHGQSYSHFCGTPGISPSDVAITTGCNMAFLVILMLLCPPSTSSILLPLPAYFNHSMSASLQSVHPQYIPCDPDNRFTPDILAARQCLEKGEIQLEDGRRVTIRCVVLVSPSNPTGCVLSHAEVKAWFELAREFGVALVMDETYRDFVCEEDVRGNGGDGGDGGGGEGRGQARGVPHGLFTEEGWRGTLISLGSFSKGYRIPGHRLGSIIASPQVLERVATICDCMQICPPRPPQLALTPLLPSLRPDLLTSSLDLSHRRFLFLQTVTAIQGWSVASIGGFFAYVQFPSDYQYASANLGLKRQRLGSEDIARVLAERFGVVVLPGSFFMPDIGADEWPGGAERLQEDRWLRFAVANVEDEVILQLGPRLRQMNALMGMEE